MSFVTDVSDFNAFNNQPLHGCESAEPISCTDDLQVGAQASDEAITSPVVPRLFQSTQEVSTGTVSAFWTTVGMFNNASGANLQLATVKVLANGGTGFGYSIRLYDITTMGVLGAKGVGAIPLSFTQPTYSVFDELQSAAVAQQPDAVVEVQVKRVGGGSADMVRFHGAQIEYITI